MTDLEVFCEEIRSSTVGRLGRYCGDTAVAEEAFQEAAVRTCRDWALEDRAAQQVASLLDHPEGTSKSLEHRGAGALRARIA